MADVFFRPKMGQGFVQLATMFAEISNPDSIDDLAFKLLFLRKAHYEDLHYSFREYILNDLGISEYRYLKAMGRLEEWGVLIRVRRGDNTWDFYWSDCPETLRKSTETLKTKVSPRTETQKTRVSRTQKIRVSTLYRDMNVKYESLPGEGEEQSQDLESRFREYQKTSQEYSPSTQTDTWIERLSKAEPS